MGDIKGITQYYRSLGHLDVGIKHSQEFSGEKSRLEIHYEIREGLRSTIRNITIVGYEVLSEGEIRKLMHVTNGSRYSLRDINRSIRTIKSKYAQHNRLFCCAEAIPRPTDEKGIVDLEFRIDEDKIEKDNIDEGKIRRIRPHQTDLGARDINVAASIRFRCWPADR